MAAMNESTPTSKAAKGALVGAVAGAAVANPTARKMIHKAVGKMSKTLGPKTPLNKRPQKEVDSILDVFNAVKKNTKGTAAQKKAEAKKVIKKHFNISKNDLEKLGNAQKVKHNLDAGMKPIDAVKNAYPEWNMKKVKKVAKEIVNSKNVETVLRPAAKMGAEMVDTVDRTVRGRKSPSHPFHGVPHGQYKKASVKKHFMRGLRRSDVSQMIKKIKDKKNIGKAVDKNAIVKDLNLTKGTKAKITKFISKVKNSGRQIDKDVVDAFYKTDLVSKKSGTAYNIGRHADKIVAGAAGSAAAGSYTKKKLKNRKKSKGGK